MPPACSVAPRPCLSTACAGLAAAVLVATAAPGLAQDAPAPDAPPDVGSVETDSDDGTFTFIFENDLLANTDRHYTNGIRLSWQPAGPAPAWAEAITDFLPVFPEEHDLHLTWSLGQSIFTPDNISISPPDPDDRPYAGWLYGSLTLTTQSEEYLDALQLSLGVVGPASLAEETQKFVHEITGSQDPKGWDFQLDNEPGLILSYERRFRQLGYWQFGGMEADVQPYIGGSVGNIITQAYAGGIFRIGQNMPGDYGPPRIRLGAPDPDVFEPSEGFGWYAFVGTEGRAVARNIFLGGNSFQDDSPSVDRKPLVGDLVGGVAVTYGNLRFAYTHILRSEEFDGQDDPDSFGSINLAIRF
jgi:hypothetical protein